MNPLLVEVPNRILRLAIGALAQANTHAVFMNPGNEYWSFISVLNTAHAGELFLKAIIAQQHPLLIFKDVFALDDNHSDQLDIETMISKGRTYEFEKLPQILWATTGIRIENMDCFERLRKARNAIQHFCVSDEGNLQELSLEFIYTIIDPLISNEFGLCAIEYHEDHVGYDYVVARLLRSELKFALPDDFDLGEIDAASELQEAGDEYRSWFIGELSRLNKSHLFKE